MKSVTIYTDGACSGNPGPGGWGIETRRAQVNSARLRPCGPSHPQGWVPVAPQPEGGRLA